MSDNESGDAVEQTSPAEASQSTELTETEGSSSTDGGETAADFESFTGDYGDAALNTDVRSAIEPISAEHPSGDSDDEAESVIAQIEANIEPIFDTIKSDFNSVVANDDMSGFDATLSGSDAIELVEQALACLKDKCKSTILLSQLPKLMLISHGLSGLRAGLDIYSENIKRFGDSIYPLDSERSKLYFRGGVYVGNDDKVTETFRLLLYVPVTEIKKLPYAFLRNSRLIKANPEMESRYGQDASASSVPFYVNLIEELSAVIESCHVANKTTEAYVADPQVQPALVSFQFIKSLEKMRAIVTNLATENCNGYPPVEATEDDLQAGDNADTGPQQLKAAQGEIVNREQAIELLKKIADFFQRTERHSPISYSIRKLIGWTNMDLPELIEELLDGSSEPLSEFSKRTGVRPKSDEDSG